MLGFVWLILWWVVYETPERNKRLSKAEFAYIRSDPIEREAPVSYLGILRHRQTWAFVLGKLMTDPVWWFYLFWLPKVSRHALWRASSAASPRRWS